MKPWIEKLKDSMQRDPILATVYQLTQQGWPHQRRHIPCLARRYWDFRDELSTDDGMLLKGPRLIIPGKLQEEYLSHLHEGHLSASKVQENAKQHMYWTGIDADIDLVLITTKRNARNVSKDLRTTRIGTGLPSPAEILHGRNLTTRAQAEIDIKAIRSVLQERQLKMTLDHDSSRRAKKARPLVVGERCHVLGPGNKWIDAFVTGITDSGRSYETQVEATGKQLTRNRSHIRPRSPDIPHMHASFLQRNAVPSATSDGNAPSERQNSVISGCQQLANGQKMVLSGNRKGSIKQTNTSQVLVSETVPDRRVQPSRRAKMTRFGDNPVTSTVYSTKKVSPDVTPLLETGGNSN